MKRKKVVIGILILISIVLELVVCQYSAIESRFFQKSTSVSYEVPKDSKIERNQITFSDQQAYVLIHCDGQVVKNLHLDLEAKDAPYVEAILYAKDEGNQGDFYRINPSIQDKISHYDETSQYIRLHLYGTANEIRVEFPELKGKTLTIHQISLNQEVPFSIHVERWLGMLILLFAITLFLPKSPIYTVPRSSDLGRMICGISLIVQILLLTAVTFRSETYINVPWSHHDQYQELAHSLSEGHFDLNIIPDEKLVAMENPYDGSMRDALGVRYRWDHAFFEGRYYVYFGVVPVILCYLPYYLLTGLDLPNIVVCYLSFVALAVGLMCMLHQFACRIWNAVSAGMIVLLDWLLFLGSGVFILACYPVLYSIPIGMGLALTVWGLYFWLKGTAFGEYRRGMIFIGSLCLSLVAGCRPQLLMASFFALFLITPVLWNKRRGSKKTLAFDVFSFAIPYMVIAAGLMYYNYARFGSVFDFGANYNLTTNDMTHRGFEIARIPLGIFMYLLQPLNLSAQEPFLRGVLTYNNYHGITIMETMLGGYIWFAPCMLVCCLIRTGKEKLKEKRCYGIAVSSLTFGFIIAIADLQMAGILRRYMCDFGLFFMLASVLVIMGLFTSYKNALIRKILYSMVYIMTLLTVFVWGLYLMSV